MPSRTLPTTAPLSTEVTGPPLTLDLTPDSLGPFTLGDSLFSTLDYLRGPKGRDRFPWVHVKYSPTALSTSPILIHLPPAQASILLHFASPEQKLVRIYLLGLPATGRQLTLTHDGGRTTLAHPRGRSLTRGDVAKVFGPTFDLGSRAGGGVASGEEGGEEGRREVWYPGLGFAFDSAFGGVEGIGRGEEVRSITLGRREDHSVGGGSGRVLMARKSSGLPTAGGVAAAAREGSLVRAVVDVTERCLTLDFAGPPPNSPSHEWPTTQVKIAVGRTTLSDLSIELGAPLRIFYREDERMRIHRRTGGGSPGGALSGRFEGEGSVGGLSEDDGGDADEEDGCFFANYFQYGLDFLIRPSDHTVCKIVLHSNLPGSVLFGRYERCPWEFSSRPEEHDLHPAHAAPLTVTTKASLLYTYLEATAVTSSSPSPSPSPTPSASPPLPSIILSEVKRSKKTAKRAAAATLAVPGVTVTDESEVPRAADEQTASPSSMEGMTLDRCGEGWGEGVLLESTTLVAVLPRLVFEVLRTGDVETVMMT